jgi:hypothetical protein
MSIVGDSSPRPGKWHNVLCHLAGLLTGSPMVVFLLLSREALWTRRSVLGFVMAACMSFGVGYVTAKVALRLPFYRADFSRPKTWLYRPWAVLVQMSLIALGGAAIALR